MIKEEYPPILPTGFHERTLKEVRDLCVLPYPKSTTRETIMQGLEKVVYELLSKCIVAKVWVDGSFVTKKLDPADVDILVEVDVGFYDNASAEQRALLEDLNANVHKNTLRVDSRAWNFYDDPNGGKGAEGDWWRSYWIKFFGFYRDDGPNMHETKGIVILMLPGCDK